VARSLTLQLTFQILNLFVLQVHFFLVLLELALLVHFSFLVLELELFVELTSLLMDHLLVFCSQLVHLPTLLDDLFSELLFHLVTFHYQVELRHNFGKVSPTQLQKFFEGCFG